MSLQKSEISPNGKASTEYATLAAKQKTKANFHCKPECRDGLNTDPGLLQNCRQILLFLKSDHYRRNHDQQEKTIAEIKSHSGVPNPTISPTKHLRAPWYKWPTLSVADSTHFKIIVVVRPSKKEGEGKRKKNNLLQDVDKGNYQSFRIRWLTNHIPLK